MVAAEAGVRIYKVRIYKEYNVQTEDVIKLAENLIEISVSIGEKDYVKFRGIYARVCDFLAKFAGAKSPFLTQISNLPRDKASAGEYLAEILRSFIAHLQDGLVGGLSPRRQAEIDVTSDFLEQAQGLLSSKKVHPAAPAVLIGAALEEFLRNWVEDSGLSLGGKKPSLDSYATTLRSEELITKQDMKDIASWGGTRNHAAHGEWEALGDSPRIRLMLEGVNLFMRRYGE
ncbi:MAG: hypothetical protein Ctma_1002 [Catillopecten margaritatus gill symbiont]|uniref:DUF4145 domain-containing protein n=1 Tax=Catillopecten margaritatus gill symbiont TaxID=3083288 RepID=A0AAU6PGZ5_9GAMM